MSIATGVAIAKQSVGWAIAMSVLMILAGIFAILAPPVAGVAVAIMVAWLLTLSGAVHLIFAWHIRSRSSLVWELLLGVVYLFAGIYMLIRPVASLVSLTLFLACYLFIKAVLEFAMAFRVQPRRVAGWYFFDAITALILSVMIWRTWPSSSEWAIGTLIGVSMLFAGVSRLSFSMAVHKGLQALP